MTGLEGHGQSRFECCLGRTGKEGEASQAAAEALGTGKDRKVGERWSKDASRRERGLRTATEQEAGVNVAQPLGQVFLARPPLPCLLPSPGAFHQIPKPTGALA